MAHVPHGQQGSTPYVLTGPLGSSAGAQAVFNDPTHSDYVGALAGDDAVTGLDSPEVREVGANLVEAHGGVHGRFYYGRRPITLSGYIDASTLTQRNTRMDKLAMASDAMLSDATLTWTVTGGKQVFVNVRRQQPLRFSGSWVKNFLLAVVAADPRIYSYTLNSQTALARATDHTVENQGGTYSPPILARITGPGTNPVLRRTWNGTTLNLQFNGLTLAAGAYIDIDFRNKLIRRSDGANQYHTLDFITSSWWELGPGNNTIRLDWASGATAASVLRLDWRDAWL